MAIWVICKKCNGVGKIKRKWFFGRINRCSLCKGTGRLIERTYQYKLLKKKKKKSHRKRK